jgi:hypothetical protein
MRALIFELLEIARILSTSTQSEATPAYNRAGQTQTYKYESIFETPTFI